METIVPYSTFSIPWEIYEFWGLGSSRKILPSNLDSIRIPPHFTIFINALSCQLVLSIREALYAVSEMDAPTECDPGREKHKGRRGRPF